MSPASVAEGCFRDLRNLSRNLPRAVATFNTSTRQRKLVCFIQMGAAPQLKLQTGSAKIRNIGRTVIGTSLLGIVMTLLAVLQMGYPRPMGETGHFVYDSSFIVIPIFLWGVVTGIGLTRAWRWSRFSMLSFGGLLTLFSAIPGFAFLLTKQEGFAWWAIVLVKLFGLLFLIPSAMGGRWFWYFVGDEARDYFHTAGKIPKP